MSRFKLLAKFIEIAQSTVGFEEKLQSIVHLLSREFECDLCNIFFLDKQNKTLILKVSSDPSIASPNGLSIPVGEGVIGIPVIDRKAITIDDIKNVHDPKLTVPIPLRDFSSFVSLSIGDNDFTYGVLSLANKNPIKFGPGQEKLFVAILQELAGIIRNFRVYTEAKKHTAELSALAEVAKSISSTIELNEILKRIASITARIIHARSSILKLADGATGGFKLGSQYGTVPDVCIRDMSVAEFEKTNQMFQCEKAIKEGGVTSAICVPLRSKGKLQGVLCVYDKKLIGTRKSTQFDADDRALLLSMTGVISASLENALIFNQVERLAQELKTTQEKLIESERTAAMGEIASALVHEIRNPLVAVGGFARRIDNLIKEDIKGDSSIRRYLGVIVGEVERLEKILRELLDFSVDEAISYSKCQTDTMIEEVLDTLRSDFEKTDIRILKEFSEAPSIYVDCRQVKYVFSNLILNAKQAMGDRGTLTLRTFKLMEDNILMTVCEIGDTGGGISEEAIHNIFNPFFTTKVYGSGLGLSIVHKIITKHHGKIGIRNEPGVGATFIIKLPASDVYREVKGIGKNSRGG